VTHNFKPSYNDICDSFATVNCNCVSMSYTCAYVWRLRLSRDNCRKLVHIFSSVE